MFWNSFSSLIAIFWLCRVESNPMVNSTNGILEGIYIRTWSGREISAFLGIPYANPIGILGRFRYAKLTQMKWAGVYPAKKYGKSCVQVTDETINPPQVGGADDCLFLNIFTPVISNITKFEVIFFIHGGGFMKGSGNMYTPDFIMDRHNLVFVTLNYRLGPFGFLSTEDEVIPGNFGLKDQVLALRWVRNNIDMFGGDKNKITLLGEDAGAVSVHLHYISPLSRHLFKHGISLGGSAFCPWALTKQARKKAERLAEALECDNTTSPTILNCLQSYPYEIVMEKVQQHFKSWKLLPFSPFGPVIEKNSKIPNTFLSDHPHKIIEEKKFKDAPWLVGLTSHEGLYPGAKFARSHSLLEEIDENWYKIAPILLEYNQTVPRDMLKIVSDKIRQYYFEDEEISVKLRKAFISMLGDRFFVADTERAIRLQASRSRAYSFLYRFGYRGRYSKAYPLCECSENMGASHGDDLLYLFNTPGYNVTETKYGVAMMRQMVDIIISFLERGIPKTDPDTVWKPVQREAVNGHNIHYMDILTSQSVNLEESPDLGNRRFWNNLHLAELKNILGGHKKYFDEL